MNDKEYEWNQMFSLMRERNDSLIGLLAYALYKKSKAEWTQEFILRNGEQPGIEDLSKHRAAMMVDENVDRLLRDAEQQLDEFSREHLSDEVDQKLSEAYAAGLQDEIASNFESMSDKFDAINENLVASREIVANIQRKHDNGFLMSVISNIVGAFVIFAVGLFGFWTYKQFFASLGV
jgi:hypothetical protein